MQTIPRPLASSLTLASSNQHNLQDRVTKIDFVHDGHTTGDDFDGLAEPLAGTIGYTEDGSSCSGPPRAGYPPKLDIQDGSQTGIETSTTYLDKNIIKAQAQTRPSQMPGAAAQSNEHPSVPPSPEPGPYNRWGQATWHPLDCGGLRERLQHRYVGFLALAWHSTCSSISATLIIMPAMIGFIRPRLRHRPHLAAMYPVMTMIRFRLRRCPWGLFRRYLWKTRSTKPSDPTGTIVHTVPSTSKAKFLPTEKAIAVDILLSSITGSATAARFVKQTLGLTGIWSDTRKVETTLLEASAPQAPAQHHALATRVPPFKVSTVLGLGFILSSVLNW